MLAVLSIFPISYHVWKIAIAILIQRSDQNIWGQYFLPQKYIGRFSLTSRMSDFIIWLDLI